MIRFLFLLFFFFTCRQTFGYPENVRHGYFACTACHVSPSGGGLLTPYGRSLSAELMSTWGTAKTAGFLFSNPEDEPELKWLRTQFLLRGVQTYRDTPTVQKAQFIPMQADLELGADTENFAAVGTFGFRANDSSKDLKEFFSRRHYFIYRFTEKVIARAGKFMHSFGLNGPDHITATRRGLGWDQGSESYNLELNYIGESFNHALTVVSGKPDERTQKKDEGLALNSSYFWRDDSRLGLSVYQGRQPEYERTTAGPYVTLSLGEHLYLHSEIFYQDKVLRPSAARERGYATYSRLGYDVHKGITPFAQFDRSFLNSGDENTRFDSYGLGLQWLPYSHFEMMFFAGKEKSATQVPTDFAWLMLNVYL